MVRVNTRSEPTELGEAKTILLTHSESSPGSFHITVQLEKAVMLPRFGGEVTNLCSCKGFMNHGKCWHLAYLAGEGDDLD